MIWILVVFLFAGRGVVPLHIEPFSTKTLCQNQLIFYKAKKMGPSIGARCVRVPEEFLKSFPQ